MIVINKISKLKEFIKLSFDKKKSVGFVPTMGALHQGHIFLIECSKKENDLTVVSIFVNPTQFNNKTDLENYPRNIENDLDKLDFIDSDIVFIPNVKEMYPTEDKNVFDLNDLDTVMEGKYREGHFNGVVQIVSKLFEIIKPSRAYFGKKDFQQVSIIKYLNEHYLRDLNIEIIACDIIREEDGLAMSSRNKLLSPKHRNAAPKIFEILFKYSKQIELGVFKMRSGIIKEINDNQFLEVEYIEIVDNKTLKKVDRITPGNTTACIAVFAGKVRLIDNVSF